MVPEAAATLLETASREDAETSKAELISVSVENEMYREFGELSNRIGSR